MFEVNTDTGRIKIYGIIGDGDLTAENFENALEDMGGADVTLKVRSKGGDIIDGMAMANAISDYPGQVRVEIDTLAASIATVFPMTADHVAAYENSQLMIHRAWTAAIGNAGDLRLTASILDRLDGQIAEMYASKAGGSPEKFLELMIAETFFSAGEAEQLGLIDSIIVAAEKKQPARRAAIRPVATVSADEDAIFRQVSARPRAARVQCMLQRLALSLD